jgi:signal transduction histidine kinase
MHEILSWFFTSPGFMPHGMCYLWQPGTLWLNVISDSVIAAAYFAIPFTLYYLVRERRREIPFPAIVLMFGAFIFLCGSTHLMEIWTVWHPDYRVAGGLKAITGMVSAATMLALFKVMPTAMLLRSPTQLQNEVNSRTAELARANEELRQQINARDLAEAQLRDRDRRKDEFLATLAHELRNPLAPIRHAVKVLERPGLPLDKQQWGREVIDRQAQRMALLLDDLLDVSRITQGRLNLKKEHVSVDSLVRSATDTVRPAIEEKGHSLNVQDECSAIEIYVDPLRLSEAISNLLTNSAKYTPRGGRIDLSVTKSATHLLFAVRDSGVGFDPARTASLFEIFSRANADIESSEGGLGIGLSLVKGLVELHGGSVRAESPGKGLGATFTILLPTSLIVSEPDRVPDQAATRQPGRLLRIVVADDNRDAADSLGMIL